MVKRSHRPAQIMFFLVVAYAAFRPVCISDVFMPGKDIGKSLRGLAGNILHILAGCRRRTAALLVACSARTAARRAPCIASGDSRQNAQSISCQALGSAPFGLNRSTMKHKVLTR